MGYFFYGFSIALFCFDVVKCQVWIIVYNDTLSEIKENTWDRYDKGMERSHYEDISGNEQTGTGGVEERSGSSV